MPEVFDPRKHSAKQRGTDANGNYVRGLKMEQNTFDFMVNGLSEAEKQTLRKKVDEAEEKGLREYTLNYSKGTFQIENGIVKGSSRSAR